MSNERKERMLETQHTQQKIS